MGIIVIIGMVYAIRAIVRASNEARARQRAARIYFERQQQAAAMQAWRRQQFAARAEAAQRISEERTRMEQERQERKAQEQAKKEAQKAYAAACKREQAEEDMEHYAGMREQYTDLIEALREELADSSTTQKRKNTIQRQILNLEEKAYKIDQRRAKAYYIVKGAC